jgi:hypothetical protein
MFAWLKAAAGRVFKTKVGIALLGALVVGGGGTAMAMTGAQAPFISNFVAPSAAVSPTAHSDDSSTATKIAGQDDEDGNAAGCTGTPSTTGADSDDSSTATTTAGHGDQEGSEHEGTATTGDDRDDAECAGTPSATRTPGSDDDGSAATHTPEATQGPGGD